MTGTGCYQAGTVLSAQPLPAQSLKQVYTLQQHHTAWICSVRLHIILSPIKALLTDSLDTTGVMQYKHLNQQINRKVKTPLCGCHTDRNNFCMSCPALALPYLQAARKGNTKALQLCRAMTGVRSHCTVLGQILSHIETSSVQALYLAH